jgi:hypothetical protein
MAFCRVLVCKTWFLKWGPPSIDSIFIQYLLFIWRCAISNVVSRIVDRNVGLRSFDE